MMTGSDSSRSRMACTSCTPSISGIEWSVITASTPSTGESAPAPVRARRASCLTFPASRCKAKSIAGSSSTKSRRAIASPRNGQDSGSRGSPALRTAVLERSSVLHDRTACQRLAESRYFVPGGEEGRADLLQHLRQHSASGVANGDLHHRVSPTDRDLDTAAARCGLHRVRHQVDQRLLEAPRICVQERVTAPSQGYAALFRVRPEEQEDLVAQRAQVDAFDRHLLEGPGERQVLLEDAPHPVDLGAG